MKTRTCTANADGSLSIVDDDGANGSTSWNIRADNVAQHRLDTAIESTLDAATKKKLDKK